jgi:hypothetical protein
VGSLSPAFWGEGQYTSPKELAVFFNNKNKQK